MDDQIQVLNVERLQALETWLKTTNTKIMQVNGQRKYGGPPEVWDGQTPGLNCEVFIKHIPRDVYEDVLIPLFSSVGPLWEFRLMMNFSGQNRGFAYAKYGSADVAKHAVRRLHGQMLVSGVHIIVCLSTEKRHVYLTCLPATAKQDELLQILRNMAEGVESLSLKSGAGREGVTAIVVFTSHYAASMAKKVLVEEFLKCFGVHISVQWQYPMKVKAELQLAQKSKCFQASTQTLPRHMAKVTQVLAQPPAVPQHPWFRSADFCRAVGGPIASKSASHQHLLSAALSASPLTFLYKYCALSGIGLPQFEFYCKGARPDGFLHLTYKVSIPGLGLFPGQVVILPGPTATTTLERAREATAQQLLQSVIGLKVFLC